MLQLLPFLIFMPKVAGESTSEVTDNGLNFWMLMAAEAMFRKPADDVRFAVLQRVMETASDMVRVIPMGPDDVLKTERLQVVPKAAVGQAGVEVRGMTSEVAAAMDDAPAAAELQDGSADVGTAGTPMPGDAADDATELPDSISHLELVIGKGPIPSLHAFSLVSQTDRMLFSNTRAEFLKDEYGEAASYSSRLLCLAKALYDNFGDEVLDLVLALLMNSELERGDKIADLFRGKEHVALGQDKDKKRKLVAGLLGQYKDIPTEDLQKSLEWALSKRIFDRLAEGKPELKDVLAKFKRIFLASGTIRMKLLRALKRSSLVADKTLASCFTRQGWMTLMNKSREVSDHEWFEMLRKQQAGIEANPELMAKVADTPTRQARFDQGKRHVAEFFAANQDKPEEKDLKKLKKAIGCDELRRQLRQTDKEHNPFAYGALQHEIASRIVRYVSRYRHAPEQNEEEETPPWKAGFPTNVVKTKEASCFSGPWLIAMLLLASGINEEDILYCNVNQGFDGTIGGHGSIILKTKVGEMLLFDHGFSLPGTNMKFIALRDRSMYRAFADLLEGKRKEPVLLEVPGDAAKMSTIHRSMQVMPISAGFASGHMLHVGNSFLAENRIDEAEYAFELGLTYSPKDPDLIYGLAVVHRLRRHEQDAMDCCEEVINIFPGHLWSHYLMAEIYMEIGEPENLVKARKHLAVIAKEKGRLYNGEKLQVEVKRLAALDDDELRAQWGERKVA